MSVKIKDEQWVYVVVQNPDSSEKIVGQFDQELGLSYIPVFIEKDSAQMVYGRLALEKMSKYEIQAILYEDVVKHAAENKCLIFILNVDGEILDKIRP
ncbi:hypothetical protein QUF90_09855 [Desulfococcaceae bacterium HSG9]|nr:hypothetical protein [Desulfococcaceae bacterium HSG9]